MQTRVSGYEEKEGRVNLGLKRCETCKHFLLSNLCDGPKVQQDPQVPTDPVSDLKIVSGTFGLCRFWEKK